MKAKGGTKKIVGCAVAAVDDCCYNVLHFKLHGWTFPHHLHFAHLLEAECL